jgi:hypothetical protein
LDKMIFQSGICLYRFDNQIITKNTNMRKIILLSSAVLLTVSFGFG